MLRLPFVLALVLALAGTPAFAGGKQGHGHKAAARAVKGQKAEGRWARLAKRIASLQQRLDAHPNAPAAVQDAGHKLLADLTTAQGDVAKIRAAKQAHDKAARRSLRGTLKRDWQAICADHKAFKQAVHAAVKDVRGVLGHKSTHAHKNKKAQI